MNNHKRIFYLDFIRVIAIFLVIFIHVSAIDTTLHVAVLSGRSLRSSIILHTSVFHYSS
ncbi:hypothetical protein [Companilactobacillus nodensis]|uniref:hypothetical protein n=1 Tax=Companilactobacillus nodensis TaxID=460870 RepID=UPI001F2F1F00|nr:hypothetical protein [Companilactobacillus nodensis]